MQEIIRYNRACLMWHRIFLTTVTVFSVAIVGNSSALSQIWQGRYGGGSTELGAGGVRPAIGGGFLAAGKSSSAALFGDDDIYVVKTNNFGGITWSVIYDVSGGGHDFVNDFTELPDGSIVLTGYTQNRNTLLADPNHGEIFIMKLDANGVRQWTKVFGGMSVEAGGGITFDDPDPSVSGDEDIIIVGATESFGAGPTSNTVPPAQPPAFPLPPNTPSPDADAFILRTDNWGNLLWMRTYGEEFTDAFTSVTLAPSGSAAPRDIVAAGYTENFVTPRLLRPFVIRVDQDGLIGTLGHLNTSAVVVKQSGLINVTLSCIRKSNTNTFTAIGHTNQNADVYICSLNGNLQGVQSYHIGHPTLPEFGIWLDFNPTNNNPVIVANHTTAATMFTDLWAFEVNLGTGLVWSKLYGGIGNEKAGSVAYIPPASAWGLPAGFIIAGEWRNDNPPPGPPVVFPGPQLYLLRTNITGGTACIETDVSYPRKVTSSDYETIMDRMLSYSIQLECTAIATQGFAPEYNDLICPPGKRVADSDESDMADATTGTPHALDQASLKVYPNPVAKENRFNVEYRLLAGTEATVTVTDIAGKEVYRTINSRPAGEASVEIPAQSWSAGTYILKVTAADGSSVVQQIVVGGK